MLLAHAAIALRFQAGHIVQKLIADQEVSQAGGEYLTVALSARDTVLMAAFGEWLSVVFHCD